MVKLREAEKIEILVVMDNYLDVLLPSSEGAIRTPHYRNGKVVPPLRAEHGLSLLVKIFAPGETFSLLMDTGWSKTGAAHNLKRLGVDPDGIDAIVLSHFHMDHHGGLINILRMRSGATPVWAHPDVFQPNRFLVLPTGQKVLFPALKEQAVVKAGGKPVMARASQLLQSGLVLVTGEIPRGNEAEKGMPNAYRECSGKTVPDPVIDDQALAIKIRDRGLVVITGCAHAGLINTIHYAQELTNTEAIYAVIGGFHLTGPVFEPIIGWTVRQLKSLNPVLVCPMHCTGWSATKEIEKAMPRQFVLSTVGTKIVLA